ncbi:MAG TPA: polysaccharide deacetylase family protein, partial [Acidimicrobiales bacterium]|nr:polysaccharide deacetylase family protein [Acidimicrobiales bacterium]
MRAPVVPVLLAGVLVSATARAQTIHELNFDERPAFLPNNTVVLTFDDGPDEMHTGKTLDVLKEKNVKATFFINTDNAANVNVDLAMQALVRRIVDEGHELANHSVHHLALALQTPQSLEEEIAGVENTVCNVVGNRAPRLTLFRAPFGDPYLGPLHGVGYDWIAPIVAKHAVHVGWNIDSNDWRAAPGDGETVFRNVTGLLKTPGQGAYGIILLHSIHSQTVAALPRIIDYVRSKGFVFKLTEDVVRARWGKPSIQLVPPGKVCALAPPDAGADGAGAAPPDAGPGADGRPEVDAVVPGVDAGRDGAGAPAGTGGGTGGNGELTGGTGGGT